MQLDIEATNLCTNFMGVLSSVMLKLHLKATEATKLHRYNGIEGHLTRNLLCLQYLVVFIHIPKVDKACIFLHYKTFHLTLGKNIYGMLILHVAETRATGHCLSSQLDHKVYTMNHMPELELVNTGPCMQYST